MRRIAIFQCDLKVGGIQKALINILSELDYSLCEVDLFLFDDEAFFEMPEHENLHITYLKPYFWLNRLVYFEILKRFAPVIKSDAEYDVAIDFNSYRNECAVGAVTVKAKKRIMWIHNDVEIKKKNEIKYRILWHFFKKKLSYFDEFAAVSPGITDGFRRCSRITDKNIISIPNHIDTDEIFRKVKEPTDFAPDEEYYNLCSMGRICRQKGFDILVEHMVRVAEKRPDMRLYIIGDGPDREKLEKQIRRSGLDGVVTLLGNRSNPFPYLNKMDGFVLTSRYEGQGLVIWEAKALGPEIFISENLEKYNPSIPGRQDIAEALCLARKKEKKYDDLSAYNKNIGESLKKLLGL